MALTRALGVAVKIEYLDGRATDAQPSLQHHVLPDDSMPPRVILLYRPGHYDVLIDGGGGGGGGSSLG
jgi:ubiquitin thioesterase protein OTUB1